MSDRVRLDVSDHVAVVTLARAEKHNALDAAMFAAIRSAARAVAADRAVRAVVLRGEGPSFCSGLDVATFRELDAGELARDPGERANPAQRLCTDWIDLAVPVVAAIHGVCFGGGLQIALGADIRFCTPDARLSVREVRWGLVPDMGITATLPRLVRLDVARELTYTGRVIGGEEAAALGLATRVVEDPAGAALELAHEIAGRSPDAIRAIKRLYEGAWHNADALALETELQRALLAGANHRAAVAAGRQADPSIFTDPERG